jgi:hypothetical protein
MKKWSKGMLCYDCKKPLFTRGMTVGRMSCETIWVSICHECFEIEPMTQKAKKEALMSQMVMQNIADNLV